jgi:signal transduction histidine kinase
MRFPAAQKREALEKLHVLLVLGEHLLTLLNDLLDLATMEAGRMEYSKDIVARTLMELDALIKAKKLDLKVRSGEHTEASLDKPHIIQVLVNLVSNAIKFSSVGDHIGIELSEDRLESGEGFAAALSMTDPAFPTTN